MDKETSIHRDNSTLGHVNLDSILDIHSLGVSYICSLLDRVGFTIIECNSDPNHHYQLLAKMNNRFLMIAIRTAYHPDVGSIDNVTQEKIVQESEELDAQPYFSSLAVLPKGTSDLEVEGVIDGQEVEVFFNGFSAVKQSDLITVTN